MPIKLASVLDPFLITPTTVQKQVFSDAVGSAKIYAYYVGFFVRSMGTATYVRIGKQGNQVDSLVAVNAYVQYEVPAGFAFDAGELYVISDASDSIIEITGMRLG